MSGRLGGTGVWKWQLRFGNAGEIDDTTARSPSTRRIVFVRSSFI